MFEDKTYEKLMKDKLDTISESIDKREGSMIHFACGANSAEVAQMYITLEWMFQQMFGDTAERKYLIKIAKDTRGIEPTAATCAVLKGKFDTEIVRGTRFSLDDINYYTDELLEQKDGFYYYKVICETAGEIGNQSFGQMIPIDFVKNLTVCELTEVLIPGEDEESTENFRQRWKKSFNTTAFGGNKADYIEKINSISGVGGCKVYRATNAAGQLVGGYVKTVIIASDFTVPTQELIKTVQTLIDPFQDGGGDGLAPFGHIYNAEAVTSVPVAVLSKFTFDTGYIFDDLKNQIEDAIKAYLLDLAKEWSKQNEMEYLIVRISAIESRILDISGIIDIADTTINGNAENLVLGINEIPTFGNVGEISG